MIPARGPVDFASETMTLVLAANPTAAETSFDITEIWNGEPIVKDLPFTEFTGSMRMPEAPVQPSGG